MNKKLFLFAFLAAALVALPGCRRVDVRDCTIAFSSLSAADQPVAAQALARYAGVDGESLKWDMTAKTLTLRYDSMQVAQTNLRMALADKGLKVIFPENTTGRAGY